MNMTNGADTQDCGVLSERSRIPPTPHLEETETLHARQSEETDAWESRIRYDERGRKIERFATGGVRITSEYDFAGRLEARCTYAGTESRGHRFYAWRRNDRLLSMRSHLRKSPNGAYVLGENVTPSQGVTLVQDWLKAQGLY